MSTEIAAYVDHEDRDMGYYEQIAARVLALCKSHDPMFANAGSGMTIAWAGQFSTSHLGYTDLTKGVRGYYAEAVSGSKPLPADIIRAARRVLIDERERETPAQRAEREWERDCHIARSLGEELPDRPGGTKTGMPEAVRAQLNAWTAARKPA